MTELQDIIDNCLHQIDMGFKKAVLVSNDYVVTAYTMTDSKHIRIDITEVES